MADDVSGAVREMETEAARLREEAKASAAEKLRKARDEAEKIASGDLPMDEVAAECDARVKKARENAEGALGEADETARALREYAAAKVEDCVAEIVRVVTGKGT